MNTQHRRERLKELIAKRFKGDRGAFLAKTRLTKGRLTQLLDPDETFGERAARAFEKKVGLPPMWLDVTDSALPGQPTDGRLLVPVTLREEKLLAYFKALTPELQDEVIDAARERAYAKQVIEKTKGTPIKRHVGNVAMELAYGLPDRDENHPK